MSAENESVVRGFYEEMNNGRKNELAGELFPADHQLHDPQIPTADGPEGMVAAVSNYQNGVNGHGDINDIFSSGDKVVVRWTGTGEHVAELNGIPHTGKKSMSARSPFTGWPLPNWGTTDRRRSRTTRRRSRL